MLGSGVKGHCGEGASSCCLCPIKELNDWSVVRVFVGQADHGQLGFPREYVPQPRCAEGCPGAVSFQTWKGTARLSVRLHSGVTDPSSVLPQRSASGTVGGPKRD